MSEFGLKALETTARVSLVNFDDATSVESLFLWEKDLEQDLDIYLFRESRKSVVKEIEKSHPGNFVKRSFRDFYCELFDVETKKTFCFFDKGISVDFMIDREVTQSFLVFQDAVDVIFLHAATIVMDGKAYLFIAPSGGGKTTISELAHENGYKVLGDESCIIKRKGNKFYTGEFPVERFSGDWKKIWEIGGIFFLNKAQANKVGEISVTRALQRALPQAIYFYRDRVREGEEIGDKKRVFGFLNDMLDLLDFRQLDFKKDGKIFSCLK